MITATRGYIEGITTALAQKTGIKFVEGDQWQSDVKHKVLTYNPVDLTSKPAFVVKGLILHETAHVKHTKPSEESPLLKQHPVMQDVYNVLEDIRIEKRMVDDYGDYAKEGFSATNIYGGAGHAENVRKGVWETMPRLNQFLLGTLAYNTHQTYGGDQAYRDWYTIYDGCDKRVQQLLNDLCSEIPYDVKKMNSTADVQAYADNVLYPKIKELVDEQQGKKPEPVHKTKEGRGITGNPKKIVISNAVIPEESDLELLLSPYINTLARRLGDILKEKASTRYTGSHKSGKLLSKNAYKILADETRVFSKKNNPNKPKYVTTIVLDGSGSMQGDRHYNTYIGAYLIRRASEKLGFPVKIIQFSNSARVMDKLLKYKTNFIGDGTSEQSAINLLKQETNPNNDNLVFILTDGGSNDNVRPDVEKMMKDGYSFTAIAVGLSERDSEGKRFIGLLRKHYPSLVLAPEVDQLPALMIQEMRKFIHR